jgi:hemerythrin superfamily protein
MAKSKRTSHNGSRRATTKNGPAKDAIALLKADHRQVEEWFSEFEKAKDGKRKATLARQICNALKVHTQIEEEIFYPAFLKATEEADLHHEAEVEHNGAKRLIADIESMPSDDYFDARVTVLSEMIKHHVKEEEKPREGMFAKARNSGMDLDELGARLQARKSALEGNESLVGKARKFFEAA